MRIDSGVGAGDVYEYLGSGLDDANLSQQDYSDSETWALVSLAGDAVQVGAYIADSSIEADGDLTLSALSDQTVDTRVASGSVAVSGGAVGASLSGAGVFTENRIHADVNAYIDQSLTPGTAIEAGSVTLNAQDTSLIKADAAAASLAASFGGVGGLAISLGASVARNRIENEIEAYILGADSLAARSGDVVVDASEDASIATRAEAAAFASSFSPTNFSVSGAGAVAINRIGTDTLAAIQDSQVASAGDVTVTALDSSVIDAVAIGLAGAQTGACGAAIASNFISGSIGAEISGSGLSSGGTVWLTADSTAAIQASAAGVAFSSAGLSLAGGVALNQIATIIEATLSGSEITADAVSIRARDASEIVSLAGTVAVGAVAGVGGAAAYNDIGNEVRAQVLGSSLVASDGSISLEALGSGSIEADAAGGAGGALAGVAGTIAVQTIANTVEATVTDSDLSACDTILVLADWSGAISADGGSGAIGGILGIGGTIVLNTLLNTVGATVSGSTLWAGAAGAGRAVRRTSREENDEGFEDDRLGEDEETFSGIAVIASAEETLDNAFATGSIGIVGLAVNKAVNLIADSVSGTVTGSSLETPLARTGGVRVSATQTTDIENEGGAAGLSGIGVVGGFDTTIIDTTVLASVDSPAGVNNVTAGSGGVEVSAWSQELVSSRTGSAAVSAIAGAAGAVSAVEILGSTTAFIGETDVASGGGLGVLATDISDVATDAGALSASLLVGVGGAVDYVTIDRDTSAGMSGVRAEAAGSVEVAALNHASITGNSGTAGGGGIVAVVGTAAVHLIEGSTEAFIGAGVARVGDHWRKRFGQRRRLREHR